MQAMPTQQPPHGLPGKSLCALRRSKAGTMQMRSNLRKAVARLAQPIDMRQQVWIRGQLVVPCDRTPEAMRAGHAPSPLQRHIDLFAVLVHIDGHALHQQAHDLLSVLGGCFRCLPHGWHILSQAQDRLTFRRRQRKGPLAAEPGILFLQLLLVTECLFPLSLQLTGHQAIFRLDGFVLPGRPLGVIVRPLQALVPMGLSLLAFGTQGLLRCHTQLKRRRLEHLHDLFGNKVLQKRPGEAEAPRRPVINRGPHAGVAQVIGLAPVSGHQPPPAAPTHQQADQ